MLTFRGDIGVRPLLYGMFGESQWTWSVQRQVQLRLDDLPISEGEVDGNAVWYSIRDRESSELRLERVVETDKSERVVGTVCGVGRRQRRRSGWKRCEQSGRFCEIYGTGEGLESLRKQLGLE